MRFFKVLVRGIAFAGVLTVGLPIVDGSQQLAGISQAEAQGRNIAVQGNRRVDAETVRNYVKWTPGRPITEADINELVKALFATGLFSNVDIRRTGSGIVVIVVENPIINAVSFSGNKKIKSDALGGLVETKSRSMLSDARVQSDAKRLQAYYARQGRAAATVTPDIVRLDENRVDVVFRINEGDRTGIATISFVGNKAYSGSRLKSVIQTRQTNWLSWLTKRDVYDQDKLNADQELLRRFYMRNGYADFQVISATSDFNEQTQRYTIVFTVDEGPRYVFGDIHIDSSIPEISEAQLRSYVRTVPGRTFDSTKIEKTLEDITLQLAQSGYAFAQVRPRGDRNYETHTISLTYLVDEGPRVYIERINIRGNTKTRDYVIRREFDIAEGDAYNRVLIDRVQRRLKALGFFKQVTIGTEPGSAPDRVIVNVDVEEDATGDFSISGGYSTSVGFIAELGVTERNFLGRGQYLKLSVGLGQDGSRTYAAAFTEPYFLGQRMALGFDLYSRTGNDTDEKPYDSETIGGGVRLGLPITDNFDLTLNYKISQMNITNSGVGYWNQAEIVQFYPNGKTLTSSIGYGAAYSTIDNKLTPHSGFFVRVNQDAAGVGGDTRFLRSTLDARLYREIVPETDIIGMLKFTGGNITGIGQEVRTADNFATGGEMIRGFANMGFGPRTGNGLPLGAKNYLTGTAEVQFPMPLIPDDFGLKGAVFADAGVAFGADAPQGFTGVILDDRSLRSSVGVSLLWNSPFGLLRGDFAQVLTKQNYDQTQFFRFSAGTQF